jgi:L-lactate dehydrogenase complex protein LldE
MKVSLFATCLVDMFQSNVGKAKVELLERLGCEIDFPESQVCCGQPAYNSGYVEAMKKLIATFESAEYVVSPSGSCVAIFYNYERYEKRLNGLSPIEYRVEAA